MRAEKFDRPGEYVTYKDFDLQSEIFLFGKKFRICDCDNFTRKFFEEKGVKLNAPEMIPEIVYEDKLKNVDLKANQEAINNLKEYIEVKLGGGHPNKNLNQFLENDRRVLRFDINWYDEKYDKEEKPYIMHYYLADGSVSVKY
jgi:hypothetical protein